MQSYRTAATRLRHPVNVALHTNAPLGVRVANGVTGFMGSWKFIILQTIVVAVWVAGNIYLLFHFDPYPFIFSPRHQHRLLLDRPRRLRVALGFLLASNRRLASAIGRRSSTRPHEADGRGQERTPTSRPA